MENKDTMVNGFLVCRKRICPIFPVSKTLSRVGEICPKILKKKPQNLAFVSIGKTGTKP